MPTKRLTILHSNDMHGDFLAEVRGEEGRLIGGLSLLSGYLNRVRREEKNVLYVISGDMVQGSLIDSEFKGISTIELMNYLAPDVATLGNHELDYGLPHLLFLEKMANFPIVNANLYIKKYHKRLMRPHIILNVDGFDIMFIGIITETVLQSLKQDRDIGTFITLEDAATEVGRIMRPENRTGEGECFQVNRGVRALYNEAEKRLESLAIRGIPVAEDRQYTLLLQGYHYTNSGPNIGLTAEELTALAPPKVVSTSARDVVEEYLRSHQNLQSQIEGRLVYH
ncbi:MAG: metallophosphoesterase [Anaerolineae bacterium]|nr:metallophosphoesterase [Anaerolineae bacterium]MDW8069534.1 metallophosphoesterase [Anaerolineae bacterium]